MASTIKRLTDNEVEITLEIPWPKIEEARRQAVEKLAKEVEMKGFRKGKAPPELAREKIDPEKLLQQTIEEALPPAYAETIKSHGLKPVIPPQVKTVSLEENKSWVFRLRTAEAPVVSVDNYKDIVRKTKKETPDIWTPGKETKERKNGEKKEENPDKRLAKILEALLAEIKISFPKLVIEQETNRLLAQTLDEIKSLGMTLNSYLASTGRSAEQLRVQSRETAERSLKLEFILQAIADKAQIQVSQAEIDKVVESQKEEGQKNDARLNAYYLAGLIRRQKTLQHLLQI
jgi:FKBP-type peptidyl-prolyl cis-trans isomerase (trigger factor)